MLRKTGWILVLLVALLVISVGAALAANATRPAQAAVAPQPEQIAPVTGHYQTRSGDALDSGDCPHARNQDASIAY